jgi:hypothetical protein
MTVKKVNIRKPVQGVCKYVVAIGTNGLTKNEK